MAFRATQAVAPVLDQIDTAQTFPFGTRFEAADGAYVYVKGITSGAVGAWATFHPVTGVTALLTADAVGNVGIMLSILDANTKFGWLQVKGYVVTSKSDTVAGAGALYIDGTAGRVDDAVVVGDLVHNAFSTAADTANILPVYINNPYVTNESN